MTVTVTVAVMEQTADRRRKKMRVPHCARLRASTHTTAQQNSNAQTHARTRAHAELAAHEMPNQKPQHRNITRQ